MYDYRKPQADQLPTELRVSFPLAPAEGYAWPGGYPIGYLTDDGETLGAECVNDPSNPVHGGGDADGWRIDGVFLVVDAPEDETCAHCGKLLLAAD